MSARLEHVLNEIKELSFDELLMLQRQIIDEVQTKAVPTTPPGKPGQRTLNIPQAYRRNPDEVEASLLAVFGPAQMAAMREVDLSNLPPGSKTITEMISEDREDRF